MDAPSPALDSSTADRFLQAVLRSRLLDEDGLRATLQDVPDALRDNASGLADFLVKAGKLSRYQARKLLRGVALGLVLGPYQILAPIGKGGMGAVFLARDSRNEHLLALKVLPPKKARRKHRSLVRFLREMALSRHVLHPHLALTLDVGRVQGVYYIAMEFIPGRNLSKLLAAEGPLSLSRAARILAEAADGLHHAHEKGVIHRDLKPSNIMVTPHDHAKVLDLGLAMVEGETITDHRVVGGQGYIVGTMDYIAPEQTTDAAGVDRRADVYALGCTLYFALTGRPPFPGGDSHDKIRRHRTEPPPSLLEARPDLPPEFADFVARLMAKDPAGRPPTALAVAEELRHWIGSENILPLDQPTDADYQEALAAAASTEQLPSGSVSDIPVVEMPEELWPDDSGPRAWTFWLAVGMTLGLVCALGAFVAIAQRLGWLR
jgi:serine/threonine protein kinase